MTRNCLKIWGSIAAISGLNVVFCADALHAYKQAAIPGPDQGHLRYVVRDNLTQMVSDAEDAGAAAAVVTTFGGLAVAFSAAPGIIVGENLGKTLYLPDYSRVAPDGAQLSSNRLYKNTIIRNSPQ